jgi:glycosyltransferase involved in cell wall biosynthesis
MAANPHHKILLLTDGLGIGGAERQLALLLKYLPKEWEGRLVSLSNGPFAQVIRDDGTSVEVVSRARRFDPLPIFRLWRTLYVWRTDVVHSWGWMSSMYIGPACKLLGVPLVDGTIRSGHRYSYRRSVHSLSLRWADRIVANSDAGLRAWQVPLRRGRTVYNGFDFERLTKRDLRGDSRSRPFTVIMTGRMRTEEKDYRCFLAAAREIVGHDPHDWHFMLVGDGPDRLSLINEAHDLVVSGAVSFPEPRLEVLDLVQEASVGVLVSTNTPFVAEGCSNTIMEYMACELPVVCSEGGGNPELVLRDQTGFLVPAGDAHALAARLTWLRDHPAEARQMGQAGRQRIVQEFSVEKMVDSTLAVYQELLRS